jgi:hypothetical protein
MNKATVVALFLAGLVMGTIGVLYISKTSKPSSEDTLFIG